MKLPFPNLATRIFNTPLLIAPDKAVTILAALSDRFKIEEVVTLEGRALGRAQLAEIQASALEQQPGRRDAYDVVEGVAVIPVYGTLVAKWGLDPYSGMTGYDGIRTKLNMALGDSQVRGILFDIDSPGGEVSGCDDLAELIYASRGQKPLHAVLTDSAYSAAYWIASACDRISVPRTGGVGSIGVYALHVDYSSALADSGIKVTFIRRGERKAEGNPYEPLSDAARAAFQADIDETFGFFTSAVARNRGLALETIVGTESAALRAGVGLELGLVDAVEPTEQAVTELFASFQDRPTLVKGAAMKRNVLAMIGLLAHNGAKAVNDDDNQIPADQQQDQNDDETEVEPEKQAEPKKDDDTGESETTEDTAGGGEGDGTGEGGGEAPAEDAAAAERARISAILTHAEAKGRETLANHLAFATSMPVDAAVAALAVSPKGGNRLVDAMAGVPNPEIGPDAPGKGNGKAAETAAQAVLASYAKIGGQLRK